MNSPLQYVLIIGKVWPEPASSAAGSRMMQLIELFLTQQWKVSFASAAKESEFMAGLEAIGVETFEIELNHTSFDLFIKDQQPGMVLFDRFTTEEQFGWRVAEHCPDALRILDTEDLHSLRAGRHKALKEKRDFEKNDLLSEIAKREIASIYRCDLSLIISDVEMQLLHDFFKVNESLFHYCPFLLDPIEEKEKQTWPGFPDRSGFISIGNFLHEPNWDAVLFLKQEIWPLIRKDLPKAELHVYGAYPSHKVFDLHAPKEGFLIKGRARDVKEVMLKAKVCLAPLRFGAGIKGKLTDAMTCGTPSVTTSVGAESMHADLPWNGCITDTPQDFANAAIKLYTDEHLWQRSQENGIKIINSLYSRQKHGADLVTKILSVQKKLGEHRAANFTGGMLLQHTALSSRYMALWIEAKNRQPEIKG